MRASVLPKVETTPATDEMMRAQRLAEAHLLDRIFWISIGLMLVAGVALRVWAMI